MTDKENIEERLNEILEGDSGKDFEDSGSEYLPLEHERSVSPEGLDTTNTSVTNTIGNSNNNILALTQRGLPTSSNGNETMKSRKRTKNEDMWKRNQQKTKRAKGEKYTSKTGKVVPKKNYYIEDCSCLNKCHLKIQANQRITQFNKFYELSNFNFQNSFLLSLIKIVNRGRVYSSKDQSRRQRTCLYYLPDIDGKEVKICKKFFLKTFQVSDGRVSRLIKTKSETNTLPLDRRGKNKLINKTSEEKLTEIRTFIRQFPTYESHYTRHKTEKRKFLAPDMSLQIMYHLYKDCHPNPASQFIFRKIFNTEFNLSFHQPISDSCKKCDMYENKLKYTTNEAEKVELNEARELHQRKADSAGNGMRNDAESAKSTENNTTVIAFDLMKTLPTPVLSTGICYYKRQLWTYCLGVHNLITNKGYMYVWDESVASRGPQEIGSCLLHFIKHYVTTTKLIMYSDQCGGQNRNIKMAVLCQYIVSNSDYFVDEVDHKFLVSGHSFLPCDQDFGLIEKQKKYFKDIYVPDDWLKVIFAARKIEPFEIIKAESTMMYSTKNLEKNITNRKINVSKGKIEWLKIQWLQFLKSSPFTINYKYSNNENTLFDTVNLQKRCLKVILNLDVLYPNGHVINEAKKKDLMELLQFVPPIHHNFFNKLKTSNIEHEEEVESYDSDEEMFS